MGKMANLAPNATPREQRLLFAFPIVRPMVDVRNAFDVELFKIRPN
jgi:hypothetical protein